MPSSLLTLSRTENQALGIGQYAIDMLSGRYAGPSPDVLQRVQLFHTDSVACAASALALGANAPSVLWREALSYGVDGLPAARLIGTDQATRPEKVVVAGCSAAREWDANGTNFGYAPERNATAGEFGHNDFYPVAVAGAQRAGADGRRTLLAMTVLDEIRGRLAEVFSLKDHRIDHVVHGAVASAAVYAALRGATAEQIESALGLVVAHYIPFRAIRAGHQLSDSKGASAAVSAEVAVLSAERAMAGFVGPADIFRNPQAIFCLFEPPSRPETSPFDLALATEGEDFAVMGMHFKLGLYEHQSAGAIEGLMRILAKHPPVLRDPGRLQRIAITTYEPAFSIIGDPAKRHPATRQSADHSMVYIVATLLRKAFEQQQSGWQELMLMPKDYSESALANPLTHALMDKIEFGHGGPEYDRKYPDGIPTSLTISHSECGELESGLIMYPEGHARCESGDLHRLLDAKIRSLASLAVEDLDAFTSRLEQLPRMSCDELVDLYNFPIRNLTA